MTRPITNVAHLESSTGDDLVKRIGQCMNMEWDIIDVKYQIQQGNHYRYTALVLMADKEGTPISE